MKRLFTMFFLTFLILGFSNLAWAGITMGELVKIDGTFYVVKDKDGKEHRFHFDESTKKEGEIKAGAQVQVIDDNGHTKFIKIIQMSK